jgi:putative ATPase
LAGVKDIREAILVAKQNQSHSGRKTLLFVDEVHRFNKAQQDAFLPYVEDGTVIFVGATTENPSFELNNALLSRARIYRLKSLQTDDLVALMSRALVDVERGLGQRQIKASADMLLILARAADGDALMMISARQYSAKCWALTYGVSIKVATSFMSKYLPCIKPCGAVLPMAPCIG